MRIDVAKEWLIYAYGRVMIEARSFLADYEQEAHRGSLHKFTPIPAYSW